MSPNTFAGISFSNTVHVCTIGISHVTFATFRLGKPLKNRKVVAYGTVFVVELTLGCGQNDES